MVKPVCLVAASLLMPVLAGCGTVEQPTEVVLVITSDYAVPSELDRVSLRIVGPDDVAQTVTNELSAGDDFPRTLGITNPNGALGPFKVRVDGYLGNAHLGRSIAVFDFEKNRSLEVNIELLKACEEVTCLCTEGDPFCSTCGAGGVCQNAAIDPQPFDGVDRRLDTDAELELP